MPLVTNGTVAHIQGSISFDPNWSYNNIPATPKIKANQDKLMLITKSVIAMMAMTITFSPTTISTTMTPRTFVQLGIHVPEHINLYALAESSCRAQQPDLSVGSIVFHKGHTRLNGATPDNGAFIRGGDIITTSEDGFVAIALGNGQVVSVQPDTYLTAGCTTEVTKGSTASNDAGTKKHNINAAHLLGAVRG